MSPQQPARRRPGPLSPGAIIDRIWKKSGWGSWAWATSARARWPFLPKMRIRSRSSSDSASGGGRLQPLGGGEVDPRIARPVFRTTDWREVVTHPDVDIVAELVGGTTDGRRDHRRRHRPSEVRRHRQQGADGPLRPRDLGPRHSRRHQPRHGGQRRRRHPHSRRAARRHFGRPRRGALRHPQRHQQLHPHRDGEARRHARDRAGRSAAPGIRRGRSQRRYRRLRCALQARHPGRPGVRREDHARPISTSKASAASRRWISSMRTSWATPSG